MKKSIRIGTLAVWALSAAGIWAQDWPQWRGPGRDNIVVGFKAPTTWPKELKEKWTTQVGEGVSSPILAAGKVYVFSRIGMEDVTTCLDADSGNQLWQDKVATKPVTGAASRYGGARSTPAVAEGKVCTLGASGVISCLDAATGKFAWRVDTKKWPTFYTSTSPIIADGKCIVFADGLTAYDLADGTVKWKWPSKELPVGPSNDLPYGSPVLMTVDGAKQVVAPSPSAVVGVALADGKLLWKFDFADPSPKATPVIDEQTVIIGAPGGKGGKGGSVAYKIEKKGDGFEATESWKSDVAPYQYNTPVLKDGFLFGLSSGKTFYCMDAKTGKEIWKDKTARGETGGILSAGPVILALTERTGLVAFEPSSKGYTEVATYKVSATPGLAYPIVSGNRVYVKGESELSLWTIE